VYDLTGRCFGWASFLIPRQIPRFGGVRTFACIRLDGRMVNASSGLGEGRLRFPCINCKPTASWAFGLGTRLLDELGVPKMAGV